MTIRELVSGLGSYGAGDVGPGTEQPYTSGTQFDGGDSYPSDINNGPSNTTYLMRASGSPYGSAGSVLNPPSGTKIYAYNNETVRINGRYVVNSAGSGWELRGIDWVWDTGSGGSSHAVAFGSQSGSAPLMTDIVIRGCTITQNVGKHTLAMMGNVNRAQVHRVALKRTGGGAASGDPSELWIQNNGGSVPRNLVCTHLDITSTSAGTHDGIQLQNGGTILIENVTFHGGKSEDWIDTKTSGQDDYTFRRVVIPGFGGSGWINRATPIIEDCFFESRSSGVALSFGNASGANTGHGTVMRSIFEDGGSNSNTTIRIHSADSTNAVKFIGCYMQGGQIRVHNTGITGGTFWERNHIVDMNMNNDVGFNCTGNRVEAGATGWGSCSNPQ